MLLTEGEKPKPKPLRGKAIVVTLIVARAMTLCLRAISENHGMRQFRFIQGVIGGDIVSL